MSNDASFKYEERTHEKPNDLGVFEVFCRGHLLRRLLHRKRFYHGVLVLSTLVLTMCLINDEVYSLIVLCVLAGRTLWKVIEVLPTDSSQTRREMK